MSQQSTKSRFIQMFGQNQWDLVKQYRGQGNRSPEATNANKLYSRLHQGLLDPVYTVYGIVHNGSLVYIGCTSMSIKQRWNNHTSESRNGIGNSLHQFMRDNSTDWKTFSEFKMVTLHTVKNLDTAKDLERLVISDHKPICNISSGGDGINPTLKTCVELFDLPQEPFGFAVKHTKGGTNP